MRRRTISFIIVMLLVSSFAVFADSTRNTATDTTNPDSNLDSKQNESVQFLIQAYKRSPVTPPGGEPVSGQDGAPIIKVFDSLSTRMGNPSQLSLNTSLKPVAMDAFLDEFFSTGIHIAMISVTGITGYGHKTNEFVKDPSSLSYLPMGYASHSNSIKITATPLKITAYDFKNNTVSKTEPATDASFSTLSGLTYPITAEFKTSKVTVIDTNPTPRPFGKIEGKNEWQGISSRKYWKDNGLGSGIIGERYTKHDEMYVEYKFLSEPVSSTGNTPASVKLTFTNNTVRQEAGANKDKVEWSKYNQNIEWIAENELWIKGDKASFDKLGAGTYRMIFKIEVASI